MARWDVNSTRYTLVYSLIMAVVVSVVLAAVSSALRPLQERNVRIEKMSYILRALGIQAQTPEEIETTYRSSIYEYVGRADGSIVEEGEGPGPAFEVSIEAEFKKPVEERNLPVFVYRGGESPVYVIPMWERGLWGPIWGYVALDSRLEKIVGAVFDHKSETPGLGAEIATSEFQAKFFGRPAYDPDGRVLIRVLKPTQVDPDNPAHVEGWAGATMTMKGLDEMLQHWLEVYRPLLETIRNQASPSFVRKT